MIDYEVSFTNTDGVAFPDTLAVNVSAPGAGDGTEFVALMVNDIWGRAQALMDYAGLTPDGVQEAPDTAQFLSALSKGYGIGPGIGVTYWKNDTPVVHGDRVLLLQGQVILIATYPLLAAAVYCGDVANPTAPAFYKTSDAGGTTRNTAGGYLVLPDARGLSLKNIGNATINTRTKTGPTTLGEKQEDQGQGHKHSIGAGGAHTHNTPGSLAGGASTTVRRDGVFDQYCPTTSETHTHPANEFSATLADDGTNGTPRTGTNFRDSTLGTNFGITY